MNHIKRFAVLGASLALMLLNSACYLQTHGQTLETRVEILEAQQSEFIATFDDDRDALTSLSEDAQSEISELEATITEARTLLQRNNADIGEDVESLRSEISELRDLLDRMTFENQQLRDELEVLRTLMDEAPAGM